MSIKAHASAAPPMAPLNPPSKAGGITLWILRGLLAIAFLGAGFAKLSGQPMMVAEFQAIGIGQWFRYLTGSLEIVGVILLLIPRMTGVGGLLLTCIMAGAIVAHLTRLHTPVMALVPLILLLLSATVAWNDRVHLRRFLGKV